MPPKHFATLLKLARIVARTRSAVFGTPLKINIKKGIERYMPSIFLLLNNEDINWQKINDQVLKAHLKRKKEYNANNNQLTIEMSFYDLISHALKDPKNALGVFDFINRVVFNLSNNLNAAQKREFKKTIYSMLTNLNRNYLNFVGELAVINGLLNSKLYALERVEFPLPNGKNVDFMVLDIKRNKKILIEVLNIHLKKGLPDNYEGIKQFLLHRFNEKLRSKKQNLPSDFEIEIILAPVVWVEAHHDLQKLYDFYSAGNKTSIYPGDYIPYAYANFVSAEGQSLHRFERVSTILSDLQEMPKAESSPLSIVY
jgi:hypothetical protein